MNWWAFALAILGEAEAVVPVFIHNPKTQAIEGVVVTTLNDLLSKMASSLHNTQTPAAAQAAAPAAAPAQAVTNPNQ